VGFGIKAVSKLPFPVQQEAQEPLVDRHKLFLFLAVEFDFAPHPIYVLPFQSPIITDKLARDLAAPGARVTDNPERQPGITVNGSRA
jgi:hypothetical protein